MMLLRTKGLVLHTTLHGETSLIAKVFTRELGVRSYMVKGVRSMRSRNKQNMMQPLSYLDMVVYDRPRDINFVKEMQPAHHWQSLDIHPIKTTLRFFASEALYKCLREDEAVPATFDYVVETLQQLDDDVLLPAAFPIAFLLGLSHHLGIEPMDNYTPAERFFNMQEGCFQQRSNLIPQWDSVPSELLHNYLVAIHTGTPPPIASWTDRRSLLSGLLAYYEVHLSEFRNFKSHEILHGVFS
ncbi:MAG: DNA repair protein RecO [Bacteroidales bacterium]|nr:DNA repair protein RecO [Bacteroidales bacterium]